MYHLILYSQSFLHEYKHYKVKNLKMDWLATYSRNHSIGLTNHTVVLTLVLKKLLVRHLFLSFRLFRGHDVWHHRIQKPPLSAIPHKNDTPLWRTFSKTCVFGARKRRLPPYGRKAKNQNGEDRVKLLKTRPKGLQIFCKLREKRIGRRKQERFVIQRYKINPERYSWSNYSL